MIHMAHYRKNVTSSTKLEVGLYITHQYAAIPYLNASYVYRKPILLKSPVYARQVIISRKRCKQFNSD